MVSRIAVTLLLAGLLTTLAGCGGSGGQPEAQAAAPAPPPRPGLEELRGQPRADIAKKADELQGEIRLKEEARKKEKLAFEFLPKWYQPLAIPGFQDQKFNPDLGFSVPSYVNPKEPTQLKELAPQYARAGDVEIALKLAGEKGIPDLDRQQTDKNYPIEWTRFVALQMHALMQNLAIGEQNALQKLLEFHAELTTVLDDKAKQGLLGQTLLPRGRRILEAARGVWKQQGQEDLASQVEAALRDWPQDVVALPLNESQQRWAELLKTKAQGRVVSCQPPVRALDLLQLPLPYEATDAFFLFFDTHNRLEEILVAYNPRLQVHFPQPADLVGLISDSSAPTGSSVVECHNRWGSLTVDTRYGPFESTISGWVRFHLNRPAGETALPRDFGAVHLDWSFEHNRLHSAPSVLGNPLVLRDGGQLSRVENPLPAGKLQNLTMQSVPGQPNLLLEGKYLYTVGVAWHELAMPVFAALGPGKWQDERTGDILAGQTRLVWEDGKTRMSLEVPHQQRDALTFVHGDKREPTAAAQRLQEVASRETLDRRQRIDAGQPLVRLPRKVEAFPLGAPKGDVIKYLPRGQDVYRIELPDGLVVVNSAPPPKDKSPHVIRQVIVRFDQANKLRWVRVRYESNVQPQIGKKVVTDWTQSLLGYWRQQAGTIAAQPAPRQALLADLPEQAGGAYYRWEDDLSEVSFLQDRHGVEVTARDLAGETETTALAPLEYLPRGPAEGIPGLRLGIKRSEVEAKLTTKPVINAEGAWVIALANGKFDIVAIWFNEKDEVEKFATRYRQGDAPKSGHKDMEKLLNERWGADLRQVGWPLRRDVSNQGALQAYAWLDDATRYRLYWADSDNSPPRLWSEWRDVRK